MEDLSEHACIRFGREGRIVAWQLASPAGGTRSLKPAGRLIMGHGEAVLDAALAGQGLADPPTWLIGEELKQGALEMVLSESAVEEFDVYALWPRPATWRRRSASSWTSCFGDLCCCLGTPFSAFPPRPPKGGEGWGEGVYRPRSNFRSSIALNCATGHIPDAIDRQHA